MAQTKTRAKPAKRKNIKVKKAEAQKRKKTMPMSRKEHEKMGHHGEPKMAAFSSQIKSRQPEQQQKQWGSNPSHPTRQGNTQDQWTERVAEGQRNPEPAPGINEFEPEKE